MGARTWEANARQFVSLDGGNGWEFAILVACSVEKGVGQGARKPLRDRDEVKVSAAKFAKAASTSADRILRYLDTWNQFADQGLVLHSNQLQPSEVVEVVIPDMPWNKKDGGMYSVPAPVKPTTSEPVTAVPVHDVASVPVEREAAPERQESPPKLTVVQELSDEDLVRREAKVTAKIMNTLVNAIDNLSDYGLRMIYGSLEEYMSNWKDPREIPDDHFDTIIFDLMEQHG